MIKKVFLVLAAAVVLLVVVAALQPNEYLVSRSASIAAPPEVVFAQVNDLHKWQEISPWAKLDPTAKMTYEGPSAGTGAAVTWAGNSQVGEGRMTITESRPHELISMKLDFVKPFASTATARYSFNPKGDQTLVTWSMTGQKNFVSKVVCLFMNMDKMIGGQFEEGLANLKAVAEGVTRRPAGSSRT